MKRYSVSAKNKKKVPQVRETARAKGFVYDEDEPEFMITIGGDGTFLIAERERPGLPKLLVRDSLICFKCHDEPLDEMLDMMRNGDGSIMKFMKLRAVAGDREKVATNDIVIRNSDPRHALRFRLRTDGEEPGALFIGDGIVAATAFGSTGYFRSVTRKTVEEGFGVAFNNTTEAHDPLLLPEDGRIELEVVRQDAHLLADNDPEMFVVREGQRVIIEQADEVARLVGHK
jgi:NAD+ kinase